MTKLSLLTIGVALALTGCGGGGSASADSDGDSYVGSNESSAVIASWSTSAVATKMDAVTYDYVDSSSSTTDICSNGSNYSMVTTQDFTVGFDSDATNYNSEDLIAAAQMMQVALNELRLRTGLTDDDLSIDTSSDDTSDKWVGCYSDTQDGTGEASVRKFVFSPATLDSSSDDFTDSYRLAKHELFHVIQSELLNETEVYNSLPYWFQEASAEMFAGKSAKYATTFLLEGYANNTGMTPYGITSYAMANNTEYMPTMYQYDEYNMYLKSLEYLFARGMTVDQLITLTKESYDKNESRSTFDSAMSSLESELNLPVAFSSLQSNTSDYIEYVLDNWAQDYEQINTYTDDIDDDAYEIIIADADLNVISKGQVSQGQSYYALANGIDDGSYSAYMTTENDVTYGPVAVTVTDGVVGALDFSGAEQFND